MKLFQVKPRKLMKLLEKLNFRLVRVHGSHHIFSNGQKVIVIPVHGDEEIGIGLLRKIIKRSGH